MENVIVGVLALYWLGYNAVFACMAWRVQRTEPADVVQTSMPLQLQTPEFMAASLADFTPVSSRHSRDSEIGEFSLSCSGMESGSGDPF